MITIVKLDSQGRVALRYTGEVTALLPNGLVITAGWTLPARDLGYTCFEPGDCFTEYYYTDRWFNIFAVADLNGARKGWYCNIAEPAVIYDDQIQQIDLLLDVWVDPTGQVLVLDEDEFAAATMLSDKQRVGAEKGLQTLLQMIEERKGTFAELLAQTKE